MIKNFYVYFLIDPRNNLPFYVGKGQGQRPNDHLKETKNNTENYKKWCKIQSIRKDGFEPIIDIVYKNLQENIAYDIEEQLIKFYGRKDIDENGILTNICPNNRPPSAKGKKQSKEHIRKRVEATKPKIQGRMAWNKNKIGVQKSKRKGEKGKVSWITDGKIEIFHNNQEKMPLGFYRGRVPKIRKISENHKLKISNKLKGKKKKPFTKEHLKNLSLAAYRRYNN